MSERFDDFGVIISTLESIQDVLLEIRELLANLLAAEEEEESE